MDNYYVLLCETVNVNFKLCHNFHDYVITYVCCPVFFYFLYADPSSQTNHHDDDDVATKRTSYKCVCVMIACEL